MVHGEKTRIIKKIKNLRKNVWNPKFSHSYIHGMKLQVTDIINSWTKDQFLQVMSDVYKDAHGVRPHGKNYHEDY